MGSFWKIARLRSHLFSRSSRCSLPLGRSFQHYTTMTDPQNQMADAETKMQQMSPGDFKIYNRMAEGMDYFHTHFRTTWKMLHEACSKNKRPDGMSIRQFIAAAEQFCHYLTMHHTIEEQHVFPVSPQHCQLGTSMRTVVDLNSYLQPRWRHSRKS